MLLSRCYFAVAFCLLVFSLAGGQQPIVGPDLVFAEKDGLLAVEAEHFASQAATDRRAFYLTTADSAADVSPDGDPSHVADASGGAYLEILPDTRRTHGDKLIKGVNFSPEAGKMAVLTYNVHVTQPGRYYVWVRAFSTGSEDNGLHVGLDGTWPATGQRLQWCQGKQTWRWESKQRTEQEHCGEPHKIYLDIQQPGPHKIHFSMREDGFEFDKWLMTTDRDFQRPADSGPQTQVFAGTLPAAFRLVVAQPAPAEAPTEINDGTSELRLPADTFTLDGTGFYLDQGKWAAINPEQRKQGQAGKTFPFPTGKYHLTLHAVGENDGQSKYVVRVDDQQLGEFQCPLSEKMYAAGKRFDKTWRDVEITDGAIISITAEVGSKDGQEFSRARWSAISFEPADEQTQLAAKPFMAKPNKAVGKQSTASSPTTPVSKLPRIEPRMPAGDGRIAVTGDLKTWHKVTLSMDGPYAHEQDNQPNPFTDYRMTVRFTHADGTTYEVPGYFAADGDAANSSAESGTCWRAHFAADRVGEWSYQVSFERGELAALNSQAQASPLVPYHGKSGTIKIAATDKTGRDLRAAGRLAYVGERYLQHLGSQQFFLKAGADAPETLLGYADFDNTIAGNAKKAPLKTWSPHVRDWRATDPTWQDGKGKGLIGAINYLSSTGCNAFSFLTYNAGGDGDNVWPFIQRDDKLHYDCSKLDQWGIVFDHGTNQGMYLHFKMQETENDDHTQGKGAGFKRESLDGGNLGTQRKLYCRELIARYAHNLALNWNLGEENTQSTAQQQAMIDYIADLDAYDHNIVIHTFPNQQEKVYEPLLGKASQLTGVSLQNSGIQDTHQQTVRWVRRSIQAGKPWIVAFDESGTAAHGQCPDLGYEGFDGKDRSGKMVYTPAEVRKQTLWGTLMGGGAGVEYYFGYQFVQNDLNCEDWRSRDQSWRYCQIALKFFRDSKLPIEKLLPADELVGSKDNSRYCLALTGQAYLVYLANGGSTPLNLQDAEGDFQLTIFNPRTGETQSTTTVVTGGKSVELTAPDDQNDWLLVLRKS